MSWDGTAAAIRRVNPDGMITAFMIKSATVLLQMAKQILALHVDALTGFIFTRVVASSRR